jgi:hypothetical protein
MLRTQNGRRGDFEVATCDLGGRCSIFELRVDKIYESSLNFDLSAVFVPADIAAAWSAVTASISSDASGVDPIQPIETINIGTRTPAVLHDHFGPCLHPLLLMSFVRSSFHKMVRPEGFKPSLQVSKT